MKKKEIYIHFFSLLTMISCGNHQANKNMSVIQFIISLLGIVGTWDQVCVVVQERRYCMCGE